MYCRNCGEQMNDNQAICLKCGVETGNGKSFCANCGSPVSENAAVCLNCGVAIEAEKKDAKKEGDLAGQDKMVMALVCFFLGHWGVHNFMMGEKKRGVKKIIFFFICGISGILSLIDFIKILMGTYVVDQG